MSYSSPGTGLKTWHVVVFLGVVILVADIVSIQMLGSGPKTYTEAFPQVQVQAPAPVPAETVEIPVAARDLPVGTALAADENLWVMKKVTKAGVPKEAVTKDAELLGKRLLRPVRAGAAILITDLTRGLQLPEGTNLLSLAFESDETAFLTPGMRIDVLASQRLGDKLKVFPLLMNTLVVTINPDANRDKCGPYPNVSLVGLALTEKQARVLELARARGCTLGALLRHPDKDDNGYDIGAVLKSLEEPKP